MADRPLSPHLGNWKWGPAMFVSILHRITGDGLALVALPLLLWWLAALASGQAAYDSFAAWVWPDLFQLGWSGGGEIFTSLVKIVLKLAVIGSSWAVFTHLISGLRHFVLDAGAGYELDENRAWAVAAPFLGIVLTIAFWAALIYL